MPLTAAAAGGLVGVALWFSRPAGMDRRPAVVLLVLSFLVVLGLCVALGLMEAAPIANGFHFGLHLLVAVLALLALRIGLQLALLHEEHDEMNPEAQVLCPHCDHVVPDTAFCPNCGVATRAASRTARAVRRTAEDVGVPVARPGYALPAGTYDGGAGAAHHPHPTADGVGCRCRRRGRGGCWGIGAGHTAGSALCVPTRLRGASDRQARRYEPMVYLWRRQVRGPVSARRYGVRGDSWIPRAWT